MITQTWLTSQLVKIVQFKILPTRVMDSIAVLLYDTDLWTR